MSLASLYLHIPFCRTRCIYCDFYSTTHLSLRTAYVNALCEEIRERGEEATRFSTIYLGGGTPSQLEEKQLEQIFRNIYKYAEVERAAEVTMELNPDDVTPSVVKHLAQLGINRVSLGIQSFNDQQLKFLRRRHSAKQAQQAVEQLYRSIENVSMDLIYGLPGQTFSEWCQEVESALALPISHLSAYALTYEEDTPLWHLRRQGVTRESDEELLLAMYTHLRETMADAGFIHYEISNFARPDRESRHNYSYWTGLPYLGLGPGAHSYDGHQIRRHNLPDLTSYIAHHGQAPHTTEILDEATLYNELVMTRLRLIEGVDMKLVPAHYQDYLLQASHPHLRQGTLALTNHHLHLTPQSLFVSDNIIADLMLV